MFPATFRPAVIAVGSLLCVALGSAAGAAESVLYVLEQESEFQDGCQDGCACPISESAVDGTFLLTPVGQQGEFDVFDVHDVHWVIRGDGAPDRSVTGSGTLRVRLAPDAVQRLELDLVIAGGDPVHFDSGLVPVGATFPALQVATAMNGFFCYDNVFSVRAGPEAPVAVEATTWGRIKGLYVRK